MTDKKKIELQHCLSYDSELNMNLKSPNFSTARKHNNCLYIIIIIIVFLTTLSYKFD